MQIDLTLLVEPDMKTLEHLVERAAVSPVTKALIDRGPGAEILWHVAPLGARAQDPQHAVDHQPVINAGTAFTAVFSEEIGHHIPRSIREFVTHCHHRIPFLG
ncbi:hypothetical protein D3C81_1997750 [compost metagenome]